MNKFLENNNLVIMEASIIERLKRSNKMALHEILVNAPLIYDKSGRIELSTIYQEYIDISLSAHIPFLMCTPTWRTNQDRVKKADVNPSINIDSAHFLQDLRSTQSIGAENIKIGGLMGCKYDCYKPNEGLSAAESEDFHAWQIDQLAEADVDFLFAATLPNIQEAKGIAKAMEKTGKSYIISFVISKTGQILDGTDLVIAIEVIDSVTKSNPLGYMINCAYPTFLRAAEQPPELFDRLIGYQANASSLDHDKLDGADQLEAEAVADWGDEMLNLHNLYGIKILGGCCGTGSEHLKYIVNQ